MRSLETLISYVKYSCLQKSLTLVLAFNCVFESPGTFFNVPIKTPVPMPMLYLKPITLESRASEVLKLSR